MISPASLDDPEWHRASAWLAGEHFARPLGRLGLLGAPLRLGSLSPGRTDLSPPAIRQALHKMSSYDVETECDLRELAITDAGDLDLAALSPEEALAPLSEGVEKLVNGLAALVVLGGDNSVTRPALRGMGVPLERAGLFTIDAHFDLRNLEGGLTNGNPVRALLRDGLPGPNIVQIGIQPFANSAAATQLTQAVGSRFITSGEVHQRGIEAVVTQELNDLATRVDAIYIDLDVDVLDRALGPGSPGARPGGLAPAQVQRAAHLCGRHPKVRILDIVEFDPERDVAEATAQAAATFLLWFASGVLARLRNIGSF